MEDGERAGDERVRRDDHLVAGTDPRRLEQRGSAPRCRSRLRRSAHPAVVGELVLEVLHLVAENEGAAPEDAIECGPQLGRQRLVLPLKGRQQGTARRPFPLASARGARSPRSRGPDHRPPVAPSEHVSGSRPAAPTIAPSPISHAAQDHRPRAHRRAPPDARSSSELPAPRRPSAPRRRVVARGTLSFDEGDSRAR